MDSRAALFLRFMVVEKKASANTINAYRRDLLQFWAFLAKRHPNGNDPFDLNHVTRTSVMAFGVELKEKGYADSTIGRKVAALKSFFQFLEAEGMIRNNPIEGLKWPRTNRPLPKTLTIQQIDALLDQTAKLETPEGLRDLAMLEMAYATGLRVTELVSLNLDCICLDPRRPYVRCRGKGAKERTIPIHSQAQSALVIYLNEGRPKLVRTQKECALFVNRYGERLTRQGFWLILKQHAEAAGIEENVTPDRLRHSFAVHNLSDGVPLHEVQKSMGHKATHTTQRYERAAAIV